MRSVPTLSCSGLLRIAFAKMYIVAVVCVLYFFAVNKGVVVNVLLCY